MSSCALRHHLDASAVFGGSFLVVGLHDDTCLHLHSISCIGSLSPSFFMHLANACIMQTYKIKKATNPGGSSCFERFDIDYFFQGGKRKYAHREHTHLRCGPFSYQQALPLPLLPPSSWLGSRLTGALALRPHTCSHTHTPNHPLLSRCVVDWGKSMRYAASSRRVAPGDRANVLLPMGLFLPHVCFFVFFHLSFLFLVLSRRSKCLTVLVRNFLSPSG